MHIGLLTWLDRPKGSRFRNAWRVEDRQQFLSWTRQQFGALHRSRPNLKLATHLKRRILVVGWLRGKLEHYRPRLKFVSNTRTIVSKLGVNVARLCRNEDLIV